ncbi:hypothetical protein Vretimale_404 [Volvox reticuliferus]|uniref:YchJ-like middle NTF2-like domain-containing protein n=1 Tax=Volvox reticuliferus TaxID=1737510 RepID=A0A8J4D334_9CHLO|nr:hypothetical protein Vretimale_404 [Volvox reticuliferus]
MINQQSFRHFGCGTSCKAPRRLRKVTDPVMRNARRVHAVVLCAVKGAKSTAAKGFGAPKPQSSKGIAADAPCPCGSGSPYEACCAPYHQGQASPSSAEALLRSRYSAYVAKEPSFIADTTHPDSPEYTGSRASYISTVKQTMRRLDPMQLTIISSEPGESAEESFITFRLKRRIKDPEAKGSAAEMDELTECSRFIRTKGRWMYLDSKFIEDEEQQAQTAESKSGPTLEAPAKKGFFNLF